MFEIDFPLYRSLPSCRHNVIWVQRNSETDESMEGTAYYSVQGKLQIACTGSPYVVNDKMEPVDGPVFELAKRDIIRLNRISDLNDAGRFEEADREMLTFALETGVVKFSVKDLPVQAVSAT